MGADVGPRNGGRAVYEKIQGEAARHWGIVKVDNAINGKNSYDAILHEERKASGRLAASGLLIPTLIVIVTVAIAGFVLRDRVSDIVLLRERIRMENRLSMANTLHHVEEYLGGVYSKLLSISLDPRVQAMSDDSREYIQALFDYEWNHFHLSEIYIVERDFDGGRRPFMTFERESKEHSKEEIHSPEREEEEYAVLIQQLQTFAAKPELRAQLSREVRLCAGRRVEERSKGMVYSVPVHSGGKLAGLVAAMVPSRRVTDELTWYPEGKRAVLINEAGEIYGRRQDTDDAGAWFDDRLADQPAAGFFAEAPEVFRVGAWTAIWDPVDVASAEQWWFVHLYDEKVAPAHGYVGGFLAGWHDITGILVAGLLLALLAWLADRRLRERVAFLSARRQAEAEAELRRRQLVQADRMASLGHLVSGVAHEINNPNHIVLSYAEALADAWDGAVPVLDQYLNENGDFDIKGSTYTELRDRVPAMFAGIANGVQRIAAIIDELAVYGGSHSTETMESEQINRVVQSALVLLGNLLKRSTEHLSVSYGKDLPEVMANYQQLEQVIISLVRNACQALRNSQDAIRVETAFDDEARQVLIRIIDGGAGIPDDILEHVTDPFFTTRRESGGIGLGLAVSSKIIEEHGGKLTITSISGEGTTMTVALPAIANTEAQSL